MKSFVASVLMDWLESKNNLLVAKVRKARAL